MRARDFLELPHFLLNQAVAWSLALRSEGLVPGISTRLGS